jgi:hypothetical protein
VKRRSFLRGLASISMLPAAAALAACDIGVSEHTGPLFMDEFLGALRAGNVAAAYARTTTAYQKRVDASQFASIVERHALDRLISSAWPNKSFTATAFFGRSSAEITLRGRLITQAGTFSTRVRIVKTDALIELDDIALESLPTA